ncbi:MAG: glutathione S-transferase N-terminal domain-containing protein [Methylophilus sp.]|jgi:stringent starvation protein A|uniref:Glutathione S-transferase N-terminal domain-containing protein n=1 Tax=Methylophilus flavus TaxID=640084 RepID=A0ABW3PJD0_9PROT|nr:MULTISPECIES: glutathione S-transferase N-terminal domain-containing protein [unclassified Methylophilus]KQT41480.1 glutathione S-transferase [Methylophilus sp. Leaf416]KQT58417.1 glutathione S-transferase [Methylophilus sp. Leaf459]HSI29271.1 glutathione S-transferase N-terminal domain-containing protein [Methylophilus sp.]
MMRLYSGTVDPYSHRCRIVLFEKGMDFEVIDVDLTNKTEDLAILNPYGEVPVLVERDLVLSEANIINEYIDERFPHPQLMPADPVMRARARLYLYNFEKDLFNHIKDIESGEDERVERARKVIRDNLTQLVPIFSKQNYLMGDEYSMLDVAITPLLWRLGHYGIELPNQAAPLLKYAERLFSRPMYAEAMTPSEKAMRK